MKKLLITFLLAGCTIPTNTPPATTTPPSGFDQTSIVQAMIDSQPNTDLGVISYQINGTLHLGSNKSLSGGSLVSASPKNVNAPILEVEGTNILVQGVTILGNNTCYFPTPPTYVPAKEHSHAIQWNAQGSILNLTVENVYGDGIDISGGDNITIMNPHIDCTSRNGISITAGDGVNINAAKINRSGIWGIDLESQGNPVQNIVISDSTFGTSNGPWLRVAPHPEINTCLFANIRVSNSAFNNSTQPPLIAPCAVQQVTII